jgi:hypothetical protein
LSTPRGSSSVAPARRPSSPLVPGSRPVLEQSNISVLPTSSATTSSSALTPAAVTSVVSNPPVQRISSPPPPPGISYYLVNLEKESCTRKGSLFLQNYLDNLTTSSEDVVMIGKMFKELFPSAIKTLMMDENGSSVIIKLLPQLTIQQWNLFLAVEIIDKNKDTFMELAKNLYAVAPLTIMFELLKTKLDRFSKSSTSTSVSAANIATLLTNIRSMFCKITQFLHDEKGKALLELCFDRHGKKTVLSFFSQLPCRSSSKSSSSRSPIPPISTSSDRNLLIDDLLDYFVDISKNDIAATFMKNILCYFQDSHFDILLPLLVSSLIPYSLTPASLIINELLDHPRYRAILLRIFMKECFVSSTIGSLKLLFLSSFGRTIIMKMIMITNETDFLEIQQFINLYYLQLIEEYDGAGGAGGDGGDGGDDIAMIMDAIHGRKMNSSFPFSTSSSSSSSFFPSQPIALAVAAVDADNSSKAMKEKELKSTAATIDISSLESPKEDKVTLVDPVSQQQIDLQSTENEDQSKLESSTFQDR